jgi:hypothetical protein
MVMSFRIIVVVQFIMLTFFINSCKKEEVPTLTTAGVTNITGTSATCGGSITNQGSGAIISKGVCWNTTPTPTIEDNKTIDGVGTGEFTDNITGLKGATTYYVRAYATNGAGTGYGMTNSFITLGQVPTATTNAATNISSTGATLNGTINANYLTTDVTFEYGANLNYGQTVTAMQSPLSTNSNTNVSALLSGLAVGTIYHFRVKAVNSLGTTYGVDMVFQPSLSVGEFYNGGYIFYIDTSEEHGLVAAPSDQSAGIKWNNGSFVKTNASGYAVGTGLTNTKSIIVAQGYGNYAAKICDNLVLNGFDDWFLPSYGELKLMCHLHDLGIGDFKNVYYWSSTEYSGNPVNQAVAVAFNLSSDPNPYKDGLYYVRAVRAF